MDAFFKLNKDAKSDSKNDSYMKQAEHLWSMLDDMASSSPDSYKKFIQKTLKEGTEAIKSPETHMCIKTAIRKPKESYLYVNVFGWVKIPAPQSDEHPIPVFGREINFLNDNESYVNIAFNPEVLVKFGKNGPNEIERDMLVKLAFQYIESQNKVEVNHYKYEILQGLSHYGDINECIFNLSKTKTKGEEVSSKVSKLDLAKEALNSINSNKNNLPDSILNKIANLNIDEKVDESKQSERSKVKPLIQEVNSETDSLKIPVYEENVLVAKYDTNIDVYDLRIHLPKISSFSQCDLDIEDDLLTLKTKESLYKKLTISLVKFRNTHSIMSDEIEAKFIKKSSILKIKIPLKKTKTE